MMLNDLRRIGDALFFLILETNLLFFSVESYFCYNDHGNYTRNSTYNNNLDTVLSSIPADIWENGFYNGSFGSLDPDKAYAIALCRADVLPESCRNLMKDLTTSLRTACPNQKQAVGWDEFCMLRYSDEIMFGKLEMSPVEVQFNPEEATSPAEFMADLRGLFQNLTDQAAGSGSPRKVAARKIKGPDSQDIYALVQCTLDMSSDDCSRCLSNSTAYLPHCCNRKIGGRVLRPSCNLRYETSLFYNEIRLQELGAMPPPVSAPPPPVPAPPPPVPAPPPPSPSGTPSSPPGRTIIIVVVSIAVCVNLAVLGFILWRKRARVIKQRQAESHETEEITTVESLKYTLTAIRAATNDFSDDNKLGEGGFGAVYKGKLTNGKEVAVKRLSKNSGQGDLEFKNEVLLLAKLQHRNLVRLLGFCLEGVEKLLVYEFVQNASLDQFIFDPIKRSFLDWEKRYKIIRGIARGILYLHEDSQIRIIHRDIKPSNVLLDGAMNPKIADFGMARLFGQDDTRGNTNKIVGTFGYMAPEYAMNGHFSIKSDVFSFGVLVLEIISGRKNNNVGHGEMVEGLLGFAWKNWNRKTPSELVDSSLRSGSGSISDIVRCIHIGLLCVQEHAADRPTMASVVLMLNSISITLAEPTEPAFYMPSDYGSNSSALLHENNYSNVQSQSYNSSKNEASISDLYPR